MSLRLAASMGAVQTIVSMALSFVSIKITSVFLGPAGLGTMGQLGIFIAMSQAVLAAGVGTGVVRRTAELDLDRPKRDLVVSTVLRGLLAVGAGSALLVAVGSGWLAGELLHDPSLRFAFLIYAVVFVFGLVGTVVLSCATGAKDFRSVAFINIGTGVSSFALIAALCPYLGLAGGLIATALLPLVTAAIGWLFARAHAWWPKRPLSHGFSVLEARGVVAFVPIALTTAIGLPLLQLLIRDSVAAHSGMASVGLLQGVMRISDMYLGVASGVFSMYFFPRFSEIRDHGELLFEVKRGLLLIVPAVAATSLAIYLLRDLIIQVIFTKDFLPMRELFGWQMAGNTLKMVGWLLGYVLLAKANPFAMAALEVTSLGVWWLLSVIFVSRDGALGATEAFAVTYGLYAIATLIGVVFVLRSMKAQSRPVAP